MRQMKINALTSSLATVLAMVWNCVPAYAQAQSAPAATDAEVGIADIIVTAQKREERLSNVPLTIAAASASELRNAGVTDTSSLAKLVPGFTATSTATATPVYTIRGVGYFDSALAATPAVTVYVDQVPLSYPVMTRNAIFDLERVEVLKGPQGTLFGQNSTGGAINYIAAKPTHDLSAGFTISGGSYNTANADAYISGPVSSTLRLRLAVGHEYQGDWQRSYTRPADTRGKVDVSKARFLAEWQPEPNLTFAFGASGWIDKSDTQAGQLVGRTPNLPPVAAFAAYPLAPQNARAADWSPGKRTGRDDTFFQLSLRGQYDVSDTLSLISLTSFAKMKLDAALDADGTALDIDDYIEKGRLRSFNQELRLEATLGRARVVLGANYAKDRVEQDTLVGISQASTVANAPPTGVPNAFLRLLANQNIENYAGFANVDFKLTDTLTLQAAGRYTKSKKDFSGCAADVDGGFGASISFVANIFRGIVGIPGTVSIPRGTCASLSPQFVPGTVTRSLDESNFSFRVGPSWKVTPNTLIYANISQGYKAGTFPTIGGVLASQFEPTRQESVLAYEGGFKTALFDRRVQLNGAAFYYDYSNKQLLGTVIDPFFGPLQKLVNIPKSRIYGAELQLTAEPISGLRLNGAVTYVNSRVTGSFVNFNPYGSPVDFKGYSFPYTPEWQATLDAEYDFPISSSLNAFFGGNMLYNSSTVGSFGANIPYNPNDPQHLSQRGTSPNVPVVANALNVDAYAVVDLRVGIETPDHTLRFTIWGRNITDRYYWTTATFIPADATIRFAGKPAMYGATLTYRFGK